MSRKKTQTKKNVVPDPKFNSTIIPKLINNIMYDGKEALLQKLFMMQLKKLKQNLKMNQ